LVRQKEDRPQSAACYCSGLWKELIATLQVKPKLPITARLTKGTVAMQCHGGGEGRCSPAAEAEATTEH